MPPNARPAAADDDHPGPAARRQVGDRQSEGGQARSLRSVVGGYDIQRLPIKVPPLPGESVLSWITAVADRYECTPAQLLRAIGIPLASDSPNKALTHTVGHRDVLRRVVGLTDEESDTLFAPAPLDLAVTQYRKLYPATSCGLVAVARYCPACLTGNGGRWAASWTNPVHILCADHRVLLRNRCPRCGHRPWSGTGWIIRRTGGRRCPEYIDRSTRPVPRTLKPRCDLDLTDPAAGPASPPVSDELLAAQQLLTNLARDAVTDPHSTRWACGIPTTAGSCFNAAMELIDEAAGFRHTAGAAASAPILADAMIIAAQVLSQPQPQDAARLADLHHLLSPIGRHTPINLSALRRRAHHPLLLAVRLSSVVPQMTQVDQLTFIAAATLPRPPPRYRTEHDQPLLRPPIDDELPFHRLPQQLWPGPLSGSIAGVGQFPRTAAAITLAKLGSARTWTEIADGLGLPAVTADHTRGFLRRIRRAGRWPALLDALTTLAQTLTGGPPPIDYTARRAVSPDTLTAAVRVAADDLGHQLSDDHQDLLARRFWELYSGGDIRLGPPELRPPASDGQHGHHIGDLDAAAEIIHAAFKAVQNTTPTDGGPLSWTPN